MAYDVIHKNSTVAGTPPTAAEVELGEIAINAADAELFVKDTAGNIRKFQNTTTGTADGLKFTQAGTGAVQRTVQAKLRDVLSVKDFGAIGDGGADDTAAIQAALTAGGSAKKVVLLPAGTYKVSSMLSVPSDTGLVSFDSAKIYATAAGFSNTSVAVKYTSNSCVINLSGLTGSPFTPNTNQVIHGITLESEVSDGRCVDAIAARNCTNLSITESEIYGFSVTKAICLASVVDAHISNNYIHDCTTDSSYDSRPQITGIEIDNDRVNNVNSVRLFVINNNIRDLTFGSTALGLYGYETDGVNIVGSKGSSLEPTRHVVISSNTIENVGEGIDTFGDHCIISCNVIRNTYNFGIKLIHGASGNTISNNNILNTGIAGIVLAGSNTPDVGDTAFNLIEGNTISGIDYLNAWTAGDTGGIKIDNTTYTYKPLNNLVANNSILSGGKYGLITTSLASNVFDGNHIPYAPSVARTSSPFYAIRDANPTRYKAVLDSTQTVTQSASTKLNFGTGEFDTRAELDSANKRWKCQVGGLYMVTAQIRTTTEAVFVAELFIKKNGSPVVTGQYQVNGTVNGNTLQVTGLVGCEAGEYIEVDLFHNHTSSLDVTASNPLTFLAITAT